VTRGEEIDSNLVTTITANADGTFTLGTLPDGRFEIRASMAGREVATAYLERTGLAPQWMGRGLRVGLSLQGKGCSRIYPAGLDDTDCGRLDCGRLPAGEMKIIHADGTPLSSKRLLFYRHSKDRPKSPEFVLRPARMTLQPQPQRMAVTTFLLIILDRSISASGRLP
jgi:hypothetical protein